MRKKRVLIDLNALGNLNCGFGQIALNYGNFFGNMDLADIEFTFLVPKEFVGKFGNKVRYIPLNGMYKFIPFLLPKVDVWHSIHQQFRYARTSSGTKQILTIHDFNFLYEKSPAKIKIYLNRMQKRVDRASVVTAISNHTASEISQHIDLKGKKIDVIYNGVQRIDNDPEQRSSLVNTDRPFFFTIGQIREKKNFHVLLDVMKSFPEHDLYIAGEDHREYAQFIKSRIQQENISNVFLTGKVTHPEKVWFYKHCEAFLFPSQLEGFGLPVIEAMQFGKAVFSSSLSSLPEICGGHAFIWENFESQYMVHSIKKNMSDYYADANKIEKEKEYAFSFSYEKHINMYLELYRKLLID